MKTLITFFLIVFLAVAPASAYLRTDDSAYNVLSGKPVIMKPSGKYGGMEKFTLTFTGFDGSTAVTVPFTLPDNLAGVLDHAKIYVSDAGISIDWYEVEVTVFRSEPQYTDAECEAFKTAIGGSLTKEEFRALSDANRRQLEECFHNYVAASYPDLSHAQTTNQWINDWAIDTSGGTVDSSRVFYNLDALMLGFRSLKNKFS